MAHKHQHVQTQTDGLTDEPAMAGLPVNVDNTEVMKINYGREEEITLYGKELKGVGKFTYLGSSASTTRGRGGGWGSRGWDIKTLLWKARHALNTLKPVWRSTFFSSRNKLGIFDGNGKAVCLFVGWLLNVPATC